MIKTHQLRLWNVCRHREAEPFRVTDVSIRHEGRNAGHLFQAHSRGPECPRPTELPAPAPVEPTRPGLQQTPVSGSRLASASTPSGGRRRGRRRWEPVRGPRGLCLGAGEEERHRRYTTAQARMQEVEQNPSLALPVPPVPTPPPPTPTHTLGTLTGLHTSLSSWESGGLARTRPGLLSLRKLTLGTALDQALLPDPRQEVRAVRAPWLKYTELPRPKAQAKNSDTAAGRGSLASEEGPYWNRSSEQKPSFTQKLRSSTQPCEKFLP